MSSAIRPNLGLTGSYADGENAWTASMNANWDLLDIMVVGAIDGFLNAPPGSPSEGDAYLVGGSPTGGSAFETHAYNIAVWRDAGWTFYEPKVGMIFFDKGNNVWRIISAGMVHRDNIDIVRPISADISVPLIVDPSTPAKQLLVNISAIGSGTPRTMTFRDKSLTPMDVNGDTMAGALNMNGNEVQGSLLKKTTHKRKNHASVSGLSIDLVDGNVHTVTLNGNITGLLPIGWASSNLDELTIIFTQSETGLYTVSWDVAVVWPGGIPPVITTGSGKVDIIKLRSIGGTVIWGEITAQGY